MVTLFTAPQKLPWVYMVTAVDMPAPVLSALKTESKLLCRIVTPLRAITASL